MVQRGKAPLEGYWSLPGGVVEPGEKLAEAIAREVLEETSLVVEVGAMVEVFERIMPDASGGTEYHYVLLDYLCRVLAGTPCAGDDSSAVAWVRQQDLHTLLITPGTLEVIERVFARYGNQQS